MILIQVHCSGDLTRSLVVDGNFTADHIRQKRPADDVWLSEGHGMMTAAHPFKDYIAIATDTKEVGNFSN